MFAYIYEWMKNVAFYLVIIVVALQMIPGETYKKYIRFFAGLILILMLAGPILNLFGMSELPKDEFKKELDRIEAFLQKEENIGIQTE